MYLCSSDIAFKAKKWSLWYVFLTSFLTNVRLWSFCQIPQRTASIATALNTNLTSGIRHPVRARYWQSGNADLIKYLFKTVKTTCYVWSCILNVHGSNPDLSRNDRWERGDSMSIVSSLPQTGSLERHRILSESLHSPCYFFLQTILTALSLCLVV